MPKYVFSSTLTSAEWDNSVIVSGDVTTEVTRLKEQAGDLLIWGHTRLAETLLRHGLVDLIDLSIHPVLAGSGGLLFPGRAHCLAPAGAGQELQPDRQAHLPGAS